MFIQVLYHFHHPLLHPDLHCYTHHTVQLYSLDRQNQQQQQQRLHFNQCSVFITRQREENLLFCYQENI